MKEIKEKWQLITPHTGRRTFSTNAYLAGIPVFRIMLITGHKTEQSFFKYIRIARKENADFLAEHPFFY
ncbi:site-specific integrase [Viscerimonas tarda]